MASAELALFVLLVTGTLLVLANLHLGRSGRSCGRWRGDRGGGSCGCGRSRWFWCDIIGCGVSHSFLSIEIILSRFTFDGHETALVSLRRRRAIDHAIEVLANNR